jgi:4'-phosphopantetheinyl transferase
VAELAAPEAGAAHVWWAQRQAASPDLAELLDDTERRRWEAYRRAEDRERFLVGCTLAKTVLAAYAGQRPAEVRFDRTCRECARPHGKPVLAGGGFEHSVTHSGDLIAVAVAAHPVGVDVEQLDGRARPLGGGAGSGALAALVFSDQEQAALATVRPSARSRAFLVAWTRKEAVTKATGDGMRASFRDVIVAGPPGAPRLVCWPYPEDPRSVALLDLGAAPGYVAALAVLGRCDVVQARDGSALLAARS